MRDKLFLQVGCLRLYLSCFIIFAMFFSDHRVIAWQEGDTSAAVNQENANGEVVAVPALKLLPAVVATQDTAESKQDATEIQQEQRSDSELNQELEASHTEIDSLTPQRDGRDGQLHTFKLDHSGNIVAGVSFGTSRAIQVRKTDDDSAEEPDADFPKPAKDVLQVYSPERQLLREIPLSFPATAIAIDADGNYVVGGSGKIVRLSADGNIICEAVAPNLAGESAEEAKKKIIEQHQEQMVQIREVYTKQIETFLAQIEQLESKQEEQGEEFSKRDQSRLTALKRQHDQFTSMLENQFSAEISEQQLSYMLSSRSRIPSIAVSGDDVFVATSGGRGFEVWRVNSELSDPERVLDGLSGCCGQFDVFAFDGQMYLAENTKFQVGIYDRDGNTVSSFGSRASGDNDGFGSCCNPMNVICTSAGEILTAESSIGKIKRFNQAGEFIGYVGKARIGAGCKHVALGFDAVRDRYYIQYQDKNKICILVPNAEAEDTSSVSSAKVQAQEEFARLQGRWERITESESQPTADENKQLASVAVERSLPLTTKVDAPSDREASSQESIVVDNNDGDMTMARYLAKKTNFSSIEFDTESRYMQAEMTRSKRAAKGSDIDDGELEMMIVRGDADPRYRVVPQSLEAGTLTMDLEDRSGLIEFVVTARLDGDRLTIWIADDYSKLPKPLVFEKVCCDEASEVCPPTADANSSTSGDEQ